MIRLDKNPATVLDYVCMEYVNDTASQQFNIVECYGPNTIQLNKLLPKIKKTEFVDSLFKMFNLYYTIDDKTRLAQCGITAAGPLPVFADFVDRVTCSLVQRSP
jgi:hypothetical protein